MVANGGRLRNPFLQVYVASGDSELVDWLWENYGRDRTPLEVADLVNAYLRDGEDRIARSTVQSWFRKRRPAEGQGEPKPVNFKTSAHRRALRALRHSNSTAGGARATPDIIAAIEQVRAKVAELDRRLTRVEGLRATRLRPEDVRKGRRG